jgi:hypothetical protein
VEIGIWQRVHGGKSAQCVAAVRAIASDGLRDQGGQAGDFDSSARIEHRPAARSGIARHAAIGSAGLRIAAGAVGCSAMALIAEAAVPALRRAVEEDIPERGIGG